MMMRPPGFMCLSAACVAASVPRTLMSITRSISSSVVSSKGFGIVHKHIKSAEGRDGLFDRALDSFAVARVRLAWDSLSATKFNRFDHGGSRACLLRVRDGHARSIRG